MKKYIIILTVALTLMSCADSKDFTLSNGERIHAEPYGWADEDVYKHDSVVYKVCPGNVVWSIIGVETIFVPIWLTGWQLYEPVRLKRPNEH